MAYRVFGELFSGERWARLVGLGGRAQRPLWASTGTKNPTYSDVCYVDGLIGPDTVNTVPESTLAAFLDHGSLERSVDRDAERDERRLAALREAGIDLKEVADLLEVEGLASFATSFDELIDALKAKADSLR